MDILTGIDFAVDGCLMVNVDEKDAGEEGSMGRDTKAHGCSILGLRFLWTHLLLALVKTMMISSEEQLRFDAYVTDSSSASGDANDPNYSSNQSCNVAVRIMPSPCPHHA